MTLLHPLALVGLIAALSPIVIYLLLRRRKTEIPWGASYLLRLTLTSKRKSSRWKQFVVLACRALILALVALLLAEAFRPNPASALLAPALPDGPVHRLLLYDDSASMAAVDAGQTSRLTRASAALEALLATQRAGDYATLLSLREGGLAPITLAGRVDSARSRELLDRLVPSEGAIDLHGPLATALSRLASTPGAQAELYLFSDFPRQLAAEVDHLPWFAAAAAQRGVRVVPVNLADPAAATAPNLVLDELTLGTDLVPQGLPLTLVVTATNHTDAPLATSIALLMDGQEWSSQPVNFQPNEQRRLPLPIAFAAAGPHLVTASVPVSRLPAYGTRSLSVQVTPRLQVWVVADTSEAAAAGGLADAEFLRRAAAPVGDQPAPIELTPVTWQEVSQPLPPEVDVVIVAGVPFAAAGAAEPLRAFVQRGGGLIFTLAPALQPGGYNEGFAALLPAALTTPAREEVEPATFGLLQGGGTRPFAPLFDDLAEERQGDLGDVRFYNYFRLAAPAPESAVLLRLGDDSPLLVHRALGRGQVYLWTSTLGVAWNSLAVRQSGQPLLYRLVTAAARGRVLPRNLVPGQRAVLPWPTAGRVEALQPDGILAQVVETAAWQETHVVSFVPAPIPGVHRLRGGGHEEAITVQRAPAEGDLRTVTAATAERLATALGAPLYAGWPAAVQALGAADAQRPLWPWLLLALLALYLFETWFVRQL